LGQAKKRFRARFGGNAIFDAMKESRDRSHFRQAGWLIDIRGCASQNAPHAPAFRIYVYDERGRVMHPPIEVECEDDDAALSRARQLLDTGSAVEVWKLGRLVGRLDESNS
jgi:hypothetical protein